MCHYVIRCMISRTIWQNKYINLRIQVYSKYYKNNSNSKQSSLIMLKLAGVMSNRSSFAIRRSLQYSAKSTTTINNHTADSSFIFRRRQRQHQAFFFSTSSSISTSSSSLKDFFNPTDTHVQLRSMLRDFVQNEVRTVLY
jgi:hypothetical protein